MKEKIPTQKAINEYEKTKRPEVGVSNKRDVGLEKNTDNKELDDNLDDNNVEKAHDVLVEDIKKMREKLGNN